MHWELVRAPSAHTIDHGATKINEQKKRKEKKIGKKKNKRA